MEVVTHGMIGERINIKRAELALLSSALFLHLNFVPTIERGRHVSPKIEMGQTGWEKELYSPTTRTASTKSNEDAMYRLWTIGWNTKCGRICRIYSYRL